MKRSIYLSALIYSLIFLQILTVEGQNKKSKKDEGYQFTKKTEIPSTPVKDQANTGTCWSFATTSFIESELLRLGKGEQDISEMFFVRYTYPRKAEKYVRYQGLANFGEGGQAHDVMNVVKKYGMVPDEVYAGLNYGSKEHRHGELFDILNGILENALKNKNNFTGKYLDVINATLDIYLGKVPENFTYKGKEYTPLSFASEMGINADDYIEFTSYSIYPFYQKVNLEVPDNWSDGEYYNVPINDLMRIINNAFENGYSVDWDGDDSEAGFSHHHGVAIIPETDINKMDESEKLEMESLSDEDKMVLLYDFSKPRKEMQINQALRQKSFDNFKTTDDHLMHMIGVATDQNGTVYYYTKNSWGKNSNNLGGKIYLSESYVRLKTIAILVNKNAVPDDLKKKLSLN